MAKPRKVAAKGGVAQLDALLSQGGMGGRGRRSTLSRWLRVHHDGFAAMLVAREPGWDEVAVGLTAMGLLDGGGKPLTGARVRKVWWETRRDRLAAQTTTLAAGEIAPAVRVVVNEEQNEVDQPRPWVTSDLYSRTPEANLRTGQLRPETESSPASSEFVAADVAFGSARSIPDWGEDQESHLIRQRTDVASLPSLQGEGPTGIQALSGPGPAEIEVPQAEASLATSLALTPQSITPAIQDPVTVAPGKKRGVLGGLRLWKRPIP